MAVPDTNTFSLQDVTNELGLGSGDSLTDCFNDATSSQFDPNYKGDGDRLSNFRNYAGVWVGKLVPVVAVSRASNNSWLDESDTVRADVVGHDVKVVWKYTSGSGYSSDFQIGGNLTLFGTTYDLDTYSGTPFQTTSERKSRFLVTLCMLIIAHQRGSSGIRTTTMMVQCKMTLHWLISTPTKG